MTRNTYEDGKPFSTAALNAQKHAHRREGVVAGAGDELALSTGTGAFEVDVAAGTVALGGATVGVDAQTVDHVDSDATDRVDLVTVDDVGTAAVVAGTPATEQDADGNDLPKAPSIPTGEVAVGAVYVRAGSDEILAGDLYDGYKTVIADYALQNEAVAFDTADVSSGLVVPVGTDQYVVE
ncbi:hypothetical protein [Salinilacihabitans rarus]|uniref:hypothetical protein n=1 Tax=Salinilacihabitans rarus TaxID=2961596 RepID=UPI0020C8ECA0|nr:hypothetical protein [Salinilacihabitans rarus]